jgi:hypothetical protein
MVGTFLHIVAFNIPYPADYGGVIDIYYKIKALKETGIQTILHCFTYGRQPSKELEELCFKVYYYPRRSGMKYLFSSVPYIVNTRIANTMPNNLLNDSFPVLFEGLHTTGLILKCRDARKLTLVRAHNVEHAYYRSLARVEKNPFQKLFFRLESGKLRRYEKILHHADCILAISKPETTYFDRIYGNARFIPAFQRYQELSVLPGIGNYVLFHGNLSVAENYGILLGFALPVLAGSSHRIVVAGKNPSAGLARKLGHYPNIQLTADPSDREMEELIRNAQVNLVLTRQSTGIKLKLLHCLYSGRHCLVNPPMVEGSDLGHLCNIAGTREELRQHLDRLMGTPLNRDDLESRKKALMDYSSRAGAEKILRLITQIPDAPFVQAGPELKKSAQ